MSTYEDRDTAITREPAYGQAAPMQQPPHQYQQPYQPPYYGYGSPYGRRFGRAMHGNDWSETKPFFLTSEFIATLFCIIGVCIAAGTTFDLDSHGAAMFCTILVAAYSVSRGIAKAGTRSHASDPRDNIRLGSHDGDSDRGQAH